MGKLQEKFILLEKDITDTTETLLEKSNNFLILYNNNLELLYKDSSILKEKMKIKIENGIRNYDSE